MEEIPCSQIVTSIIRFFFRFMFIYKFSCVTRQLESETEQDMKCVNCLQGKLEEKRPLGRPRRRWEDNIKMDLLELGCGGMD